MADGVRRVYAGKRGPIGNADEVPLAFLLASIAAELRDSRARLVRWSPSQAKSVPLDGVSQHALDGIQRALMLLELAEKHCGSDGR